LGTQALRRRDGGASGAAREGEAAVPGGGLRSFRFGYVEVVELSRGYRAHREASTRILRRNRVVAARSEADRVRERAAYSLAMGAARVEDFRVGSGEASELSSSRLEALLGDAAICFRVRCVRASVGDRQRVCQLRKRNKSSRVPRDGQAGGDY